MSLHTNSIHMRVKGQFIINDCPKIFVLGVQIEEFGHEWKQKEQNEAAFTLNPILRRKTQRFQIIFPQLRRLSTHQTATFATNLPGALSWAWLNFLVAGVGVTQRLSIWCTHFSHFLDFCLVDVQKSKFTAATKATLHWTVFSVIVDSGKDLSGELFLRTFVLLHLKPSGVSSLINIVKRVSRDRWTVLLSFANIFLWNSPKMSSYAHTAVVKTHSEPLY